MLRWPLLLLTALSMGGAACTSGGSRRGEAALRVQLSAEPASLDPTLAEDGASLRILCNTMEGLVGYDGTGRLQHLLAESHTVSADGRRYEFVLRPGARWSDGRPVTAADFVVSWRRALRPGSGSRLAGMLFPLKGARDAFIGKSPPESIGARDEGGRLVLELDRPAPYFLQVLTLPVALPQRQDVLDAAGGRWPDDAPGTGPYRMTRRQAERRVSLEKNPLYWNASAAGPDVELVVVADDATGLNLFEQGNLDVLSRIPSSDLPRLRRQGVVRTAPFLATQYLSFNLREPPFADRAWRRAVAGAVRREELVAALDSGDLPARSWVPPGLEGYVPYSDPARDFADAVKKARARAGAPPSVSAAFDSGQRNAIIMEKVEHDLRSALGLKLSLSNLDWKTYLSTLRSDPPRIFRMGILSPFLDPIQILQSFTTGDPNNYLGWSDAEYDRLVGEIGVMRPGPERAAKVRQAQAVLVDREAVVVPLYHYVQNHAVSRRVEGFRVNPFGVIRFNELRVR